MPMTYLRIRNMDEAIVVAFDMCSSSDVLEGLTLKGETQRLRDFITKIKKFLASKQKTLPFEPYKFTGDGWILLFPANTDGKGLLTLLKDLSKYFRTEYQRDILKYLDTRPQISGLTFGIEKGPLIPMKIYGTDEYIGRAINIACRLQGAIKQKGGSPAYMVLVSNSVFSSYLRAETSYKVFSVSRNLRNINGGRTFRCKKIDLLGLSALKAPTKRPQRRRRA